MANILIVGKELPESENLIKSFELKGHKIFTTASSEFILDNDNIFSFTWNKASSISAKTLLIQAEAKLVQIDRVLIIFDAPNYSTKFESDRLEDCTPAVENMVSGYLYFCQTLLTRLSQKQNKVTVGFYLKTASTKSTLAQSKNITQTPCANTVALAQGAFEALAQNMAVSLYQLPTVSVFLSISELSNSLYSDDRETGAWLSDYFDSISALKTKQSAKSACTWVKVGGHGPSSFPFFK